MNSREQFLKTVNHQQPDRVVLDFGATVVTGIHIQTISKMRRHFGLQRKPIRVIEPYQMLGEVGWELIDSIGIDVIGAWGKNNRFGFHNHAPYKEWKTPWGQRVMVPLNFNTTKDKNGDLLMYPEGDISIPPCAKMPKANYFFDAINRQEPIVEQELEGTNNPEDFGLVSNEDLEHWRIEVDKAYFSGKAVIASFGDTTLDGTPHIPGMDLKAPKGVRDVAEWYASTASRPDNIKDIFERQVEIATENLKRIFAVVGNKINALLICGADSGSQEFSFCTLAQFDEIWLPYYKKLNDWIHENTQWKTFKHSCGNEVGFMDSFIRAGFDIINPAQINAEGMTPEKLKQRFGRDLIFWGGGIDTQKILPFGKPEEVREQVLKNCDILSKDGGFIFNTVNNIPANVPVENIVAMLEAIKEFNGK